MKQKLQVAFGILALLFIASCSDNWTQPPPEAWCEVENARKILSDEYTYKQAHKTQSQLPEFNFEGEKVTFTEVAPIFKLNCGPCHRPGGNAPFPLQNLRQIKRKGKTIKDVLQQRVMPPWMADETYSHFLDAPAITDEARAMIVYWIDNGLENGSYVGTDRTDSSALRDSADIYLQVESPHVITSNSDSYQCFILDPELEEDVFVEGVSFQSTNPYTIHHVMMYIDTAGVIDSLPADWDCMKDDIVNKLVPIDSWSKGQRLIKYSTEFAYRFPKNSKILLQTHYGDEGNKGKQEQTTVGLYTRNSAPRSEIKWAILNNLEIAIPKDTVKVETIEYPVEHDISVLGLVPHLHFIGRTVEIYAMNADCEKINLLKINDWDYLWQGRFMYPKPIKVQKGSTIYMNVLYDNTENNPNQPNEPIIDIFYDTYSNQEMMVLCIYYTDYESGDEQKSVGELVR